MLGAMKTSEPASVRPGPRGETIDAPQHRALGSASRAAILALVREADGGVTVGDLAARCGLHRSTVLAHLDRLVRAGLLVRARAAGAGVPGRPPWRYRAAAAPGPAPAPYRALAGALLAHVAAGAPDPWRAAADAGRGWGAQLARSPQATGGGAGGDRATGAVVDGLGALGFDPRPADESGQVRIDLRRCPFLDLVAEHPDTMCGLHLGVVEGILAARGSTATAALEPFGAPDACVLRLHRAGRAPAPDSGPTQPSGSRPGTHLATRQQRGH